MDFLPHVLLSLFLGFVARLIFNLRLDRKWARAAKELGLEFQSSAWFKQSHISGRLDSFEITMLRGRYHPLTSADLTVNGDERLNSRLRLHPRSGRSNFLEEADGEEVLVGDASFDAQVRIHGDPSIVFAILNHETRTAVLNLLKDGTAWVSRGLVHVQIDSKAERDRIVSSIRAAVHVATLLALPEEAVASALAAIALTDPMADVRQRSKEYLLRVLSNCSRTTLRFVRGQHYPFSEPVLRRAAEVETDFDPYLRMLGAIVLGGDSGLNGLRRIVEDRSAPESVRCCALIAFVGRSTWDNVAPTIRFVLSTDKQQILTVAVWAVGIAQDDRPIARVHELAETAGEGLATAIAQTLKRLGKTESEPTLLALLNHSSEAVRVQAAEALSTVGTTRSVESLLRISSESGSADLKSTAHSAARRIQGRLGDVEAGQLSLLEPVGEVGSLSLATQQGELSIIGTGLGQVSLERATQVAKRS